MGKYGIYLLFFLGIALFIYYIYVIIVGKSLARLVGSKDRFIWNGLLNTSAPGMPFAKKRNTLFLDHDNLVISQRNVVSILRELRKTESLEEAIVIPFQRIVAFDYKRSVADWNVAVRVILSLMNRLFKKNDFILSVRYLDVDRSIKQFLFKANSMDVNDFEATFADFDNQIYSGKVRYEAEHGMAEEMIAHSPHEPVSPMEEDNPTVAIRGGEVPEVIIPARELTEELPVLVVEDEPEEIAPEIVVEEVPLEEEPELPFVAPQEEVVTENLTEEITPARPPRKWFEEDFMPRRTPKEVPEVESDQTVMIDRQELRDRGIVFERPNRRPRDEE